MFASLLTTILFSLSVICGHRSARLLGGTTANFWRLVFAAILLAIWAHGFGGGLAGTAFPIFVLSGCVGFGVGDLALFQALPRLGSRLSSMLVQCLAAPFAAIAEWLWLGTTLSAKQMLCGGVILAGVALALKPGATEHQSRNFKVLFTGTLFGVLAALGQGFGAVLSRKAYAVASLAGQNIDGATAAYQRILGGLAVGGVFLWLVKYRANSHNNSNTENNHQIQCFTASERWRRAVPWIMLNGLAGPTLGVSCYQWALKTTPTGLVLTIVATTPLVVIPFAYFLERDRPGKLAIFGGAIAVLGAVVLALVSF